MGKQTTPVNHDTASSDTASSDRSNHERANGEHASAAKGSRDQQISGLNHCVLIGEFAAEPDVRTLPSGTIAASFPVRVRAAGSRTASVPVVWYDPPKRLDRWKVDDQVVIGGSVVRRFYRGAAGLGSSTEVVVDHGELVRHAAKTDKLLRRTVAELQRQADVVRE